MKRSLFVLIALSVLFLLIWLRRPTETPMTTTAAMLSDPFLQLPTETSVRVVWFTEFAGSEHRVAYGDKLDRHAEATTTKMSRLREDQAETEPIQPVIRDIWRHEALIEGLTPGRIPYQVTSVKSNQGSSEVLSSKVFTLAPQPRPGTPLKILLTSDHQLMPMTAANLQMVKAVESIDAVFMAGDLINIPDRASEWFDDPEGGAFFPCLQGRAHYELEKEGRTTVYTGGEIIQHAPIFPAIGNHEVMGRYSMSHGLNEQFSDAIPRQVALNFYREAQINPGEDPDLKTAWLKANSFNTDTYKEIFSLPPENDGKYYAVTFGDVRLAVLYVTNIWRSPRIDPQVRGRYQERQQDLDSPQDWGYGQHIFEAIAEGSPQYRWLERELSSNEFKEAKYKVVMFHHPPHSLGANVVPPYTTPVAHVERADGSLQSVRYDYPPENDYIIRDLMPQLETAGVDLVFYGHSHLWNRFVSPGGMHFLESSNVGNSYGAYVGAEKRPIPADSRFNYAAVSDPNGLEPVVPTIAPLVEKQPLPFIASNDITAFSILDTGNGTVSSYRFDTRKPESAVVKFDQFTIGDG